MAFRPTRHYWRDGIGPPEKRPKRVNTTWDGSVEDNSFGAHKFAVEGERLRITLPSLSVAAVTLEVAS